MGVLFKSSDESGLEIQFHKLRSTHSCKVSSASLKKIRNVKFIPPGPSGEMPPSTAAKMAAAMLRHHGKDIPCLILEKSEVNLSWNTVAGRTWRVITEAV